MLLQHSAGDRSTRSINFCKMYELFQHTGITHYDILFALLLDSGCSQSQRYYNFISKCQSLYSSVRYDLA
jgi:hypothetical protein